jgi:hypothetical protein
MIVCLMLIIESLIKNDLTSIENKNTQLQNYRVNYVNDKGR